MEFIIHIDGVVEKLEINEGDNLLDTMQDENVNAPFGCQGGICGSCKCQLVSGNVDSNPDMFLTDAEKAEGAILACQSQAASGPIEISYE